MKINKLLVMSLAASFVLASCSKDNEPNKKKLVNEGDTYSSLTLRVPSTPGTRVSQTTVDASQAESDVQNITLNSSVDGTKEWTNYLITKPADYKDAAPTEFFKVSVTQNVGIIYSVGAFLTKTGDKDLGLILNKTADANMTAEPNKDAIYGDGTVSDDVIAKLIKPNEFVMSSEVLPFNAVGGVTKPQADDQTTPKNLCKFESVERLVAKVQVISDPASFTQAGKIADQATIGVVAKDLTYAVQGSQTQAYIYNNNAGGAKGREIDATTNQYEGLVPMPIKKLVYTGDVAIKANTMVGGSSPYAARVVDPKGDKTEYFLPTATGKKTLANWGEVAYITVYTTFTPAKFNIWFTKFTEKNDGTKWVAVNNSGEINKDAIVYNVDIVNPKTPKEINGTDPKHDANWNGKDNTTLTGYEWKRGEYFNGPRVVNAADLGTGEYANYVKPADGTFYVVKGKQNVSFYISRAEAVKIGKTTNEKVYTYDKGRMGYRVLVNRVYDDVQKLIVNCDTRRNNWYKLTLTGVNGLGFNYDNLNPEDPNLPKPKDDPDTPIDDITPETPVNNTETYMRFEATILPWNVVDREVVLDL